MGGFNVRGKGSLKPCLATTDVRSARNSGVLQRLGWGNRLAFRVQGLGLRVYRRSDPALNHAAIKYSDIIDYLKESWVHDLPNVPCHMLISEE